MMADKDSLATAGQGLAKACPKCGALNPASAKYCGACGTPYPTVTTEPGRPPARRERVGRQQAEPVFRAAFAERLPDWELEPPQMPVRRHR